ncbi:MAG: hypothetical protein DI585_05075 [Pseudomonas fluorescens]|nr:MAG: hypothetical protein DI585_05075 [Pseudomonas fluorescens]
MYRLLAVSLVVIAAMGGQALAASLNTPEDVKIQRAMAAKINRNWWIPWGAKIEDLDVTVRIKLTSTGEFVGATILESTGNPKLDDSLIKAVKNSVPLPIPAGRMADYTDFNMTLKR